jgi:hypothetical protein
MIINEPYLFTREQIGRIEELRSCRYVCASEHQGRSVEVFYGDEPHPDSGSRYFALYYAGDDLMITNGQFVEEQELDAVIADNGDIVFSRARHDFHTSPDGSVWIDGGRAYTRTNTTKMTTLVVKNGNLVERDKT